MPLFREEHFLIIHPGSQYTFFQFGLHDSLSPPPYVIPTLVYKDNNTGRYTVHGSENSTKIYPIVQGEIVDLEGFKYFIRLILNSIINEHPLVLISQIPLLLISSKNWSKLSVEYVTQFVMEDLKLPAFNILPSALAANFAFGSFSNCVIVDVGYEKTEITPIIDYQTVNHTTIISSIGSSSINANLAQIMSNLSEEQIESLKRSDIYEVLSDSDKKKSFFGLDALSSINGNAMEEDGILDVAKIVTSDNTAEILNKNSKLKNQKKNANVSNDQTPNGELEKNSFTDSTGESISVGKERFRGCEALIEDISTNLYKSLLNIEDLAKRQDCYDNLILVGATTKIRGFKEALLVHLFQNYLIVPPATNSAALKNYFHSDSSSTNQSFNLVQVPVSIKYVKSPEYFPEWKKVGFENSPFLGGQIVSKMLFGSSHSSMGDGFLEKEYYNSKGPMGIWDYTF